MINSGMMSSNSEDWRTPTDLFNKINAIWLLDTDVCASDENALLNNHWTKDDDCLKQDWTGRRCWMNPPYGRKIGSFVKKAAESGTLVVALLPARTDTKWWHDYVQQPNTLIYLLKGRLKFSGAGSAPFPSAVVVWGASCQ